MINIRQILKPSPIKVALTLTAPFLVGLMLTLSLDGAAGFYQLMLTPGFTTYADEAYFTFNNYVLLWAPFGFRVRSCGLIGLCCEALRRALVLWAQ